MTVRVGWIADDPGYVGGAELTQAEFAAAAPDGVELVHLSADHPGARGAHPDFDCDVYVVHNCVHYGVGLVDNFRGRRVVKYVHDMWPHADRGLRNWMLSNAVLVFTSPLHLREFSYPLRGAASYVLPPPMDLAPFRAAAGAVVRNPGALLLANHGKGYAAALEWAAENGLSLDAYGLGTPGCSVAPDDVPPLMASYTHFVHLPNAPEPFGRTVVEAAAAGCVVHTNENVGATHWQDTAPRYLQPGVAAEAFWRLVLA